MAIVKTILFRKDRTWLLAAILIMALMGVAFSSFSTSNLAHASAPVGASAVMQNSTTTTVDIVVTGTDFDAFESSDTSTADATDRAGITYNSTNPTAAVIDNSTTMTLTFALATGTGKSGGSLTIDANMVEDASNVLNSAITIVNGSITDSAIPQLDTATNHSYTDNDEDGTIDRVTINFTEAVTITYSDGDWTIVEGGIFGFDVASILSGNGTAAVVFEVPSGGIIGDVTGANNFFRTGAEPTIAYTNTTGSIVDGDANELTSISAFSTDDAALPRVRSSSSAREFQDNDLDGQIDRIDVKWTEYIDVIGSFSAGNHILVDGTDVIYATPTATNDPADADDDLFVSVLGPANVTGESGTASTYTYTNTGNDFIEDMHGNVAVTQSAVTLDDGARAQLVSVSPSDSATGVSRTASIVYTFTEDMDATVAFNHADYFTATPNVGNWSTVWSSGDTVLTLTHATFGCLQSISINSWPSSYVTGEADGNDVGEDVDTGDWSFTTASCTGSSGGGGGSNSVAKTYLVDLTSLDDGIAVSAGDSKEITWTSGGTGVSNYVNLYYSLDGGVTYTTIATNAKNSGSYSWTVPSVETAQAQIKVETTDLVLALATDTSTSLFSIVLPENTTPSEEVTAPKTGDSGVSPVTGEVEDISTVNGGDYITSPGFSTIYYVDNNLVRHPFIDSQTYLTWQSSFASTKTVTDATLPNLIMGSPMLPKSGVVLVKVQSDPKVYAVEASGNIFSPTLRWVISERIAEALYSEDWADYVIDVPVTMFSRFQFGADVTSISDISVDLGSMKKRVDLN